MNIVFDVAHARAQLLKGVRSGDTLCGTFQLDAAQKKSRAFALAVSVTSAGAAAAKDDESAASASASASAALSAASAASAAASPAPAAAAVSVSSAAAAAAAASAASTAVSAPFNAATSLRDASVKLLASLKDEAARETLYAAIAPQVSATAVVRDVWSGAREGRGVNHEHTQHSATRAEILQMHSFFRTPKTARLSPGRVLRGDFHNVFPRRT